MSLEKWVEYGWLKREATSPDEIHGLLSIVDRGLHDSKVEAISIDLRFIAAFNSGLAAATAALRAGGFSYIYRSWPSCQNHRLSRIYPSGRSNIYPKVESSEQQAEPIKL